MCLIVFAHDVHPEYRLILAANRDEFHDRPSTPLAVWDDAPDVIGGRDLRSGGTWLAVSRSGRWAAVTNFRDPAEFDRTGPSRGHLVADFVRGDDAPEPYLIGLRQRDTEYNGYNLVVGTEPEVWWTSNRAAPADAPRRLSPGI
ncbi:MAG TPA: NRDE family protein, partial [Longimicrobiaceae bacterium]|nr:NRDE family protein [Longimicrobiaceae bacterium]